MERADAVTQDGQPEFCDVTDYAYTERSVLNNGYLKSKRKIKKAPTQTTIRLKSRGTTFKESITVALNYICGSFYFDYLLLLGEGQPGKITGFSLKILQVNPNPTPIHDSREGVCLEKDKQIGLQLHPLRKLCISIIEAF